MRQNIGVEVQQNTIHNRWKSYQSAVCLLDYTMLQWQVSLIAVFPARTFEGEKSGKFATLMIADNEGILRVVLWNDKADLVEKGELKVGQAVGFIMVTHEQDRYGKVELHIGR